MAVSPKPVVMERRAFWPKNVLPKPSAPQPSLHSARAAGNKGKQANASASRIVVNMMVRFFIKLIFLSSFLAFLGFSLLPPSPELRRARRAHFWPFTDVLRRNPRCVTLKMQKL